MEAEKIGTKGRAVWSNGLDFFLSAVGYAGNL